MYTFCAVCIYVLGSQEGADMYLHAWPGPPWVEPAGNCEHYPPLQPTNSHAIVADQAHGILI